MNSPRFLVPCSVFPERVWQKDRPKPLPLRLPSVFVSVFLPSVFSFRCVSLWIPSFARNISSCWSRGRDHSRVTPDCSWSLPASPPTRTTRSVRSTTPAWTSCAERRRLRMALERISSPLWSGHWRETDLRSLPVPKRIAVPLPTQCPAHHLPAAWSACLSPLLTESQSPPRPTSHCCTERQSWGSLRSRNCKWCQSRCVSRQQRPPWGRTPRMVWARWGAPPPAPQPPGSTPRRSPAPSALPRTSGFSPSPLLFGSPSPPRAPAPPPLVGPLESAATPPPWLLPPPWATIMAVAWVPPGSSCSGSLLSLPWLLPLSLPPWSLSAGPLPGVRPPLGMSSLPVLLVALLDN